MTEFLAVYAAIVATGSLVVAVLAFRSGTPRMRPETRLRPSTKDSPAELLITVRNRSRASGEVLAIELDSPGPFVVLLGTDIELRGPSLPALVPPHSLLTWAVDAGEVRDALTKAGRRPQARAVVRTGNGRTVVESIHSYTPLAW